MNYAIGQVCQKQSMCLLTHVLCRLAMLGFALAVFGEITTGRNVFQQVNHAPLAVASVFVTLIIATAVPVVRGLPRKNGLGPFTSDAELVNGRCVARKTKFVPKKGLSPTFFVLQLLYRQIC